MFPMMYGCDVISHEEDAHVALALVRIMDVSWKELFSIKLCRRL